MGSDIYGFRIVDDLTGDFEYSPPFHMIIPGSTFVDPSKDKDKEEEEEEEEEKPTSTTSTSSRTSTTSTPSTTSTKSTTTKSTTEKPTTTTTSTTKKPTTSTTTESTTTEEEPTPTPDPTEDANAQQTPKSTPTDEPAPAKEEKKDKGKPLGIPVIAWVGIGIGGLFAALILTYCISLGVRNHKLRKEERERSLMPGTDIKPTQAAGPYKQLDDVEKGALAETNGTVPYGAAAFVTPQRGSTTTSNYNTNAGFGGSNQRGNNIEMAEYGSRGNNGGYYEEPAYNQNHNGPQQGGQHGFRDGYGQQQQPFRGPQQGYPSAGSNGAFPEHYGNYPSQQQPYNAGNGNHSYRY
jgi:hypothetical protein